MTLTYMVQVPELPTKQFYWGRDHLKNQNKNKNHKGTVQRDFKCKVSIKKIYF